MFKLIVLCDTKIQVCSLPAYSTFSTNPKCIYSSKHTLAYIWNLVSNSY